MDRFYEGLKLKCAFYSANSWIKSLIMDSDISLIDYKLIKCILPKTYAKRGFNRDDVVDLKVSVDNRNWISLEHLNVVSFSTYDIIPSVIEYGGSREITIQTGNDLRKTVYEDQ